MKRPARKKRHPVDEVDYESLADLRYHIRRFLRTREEAALLLLQVSGLKRLRPVTIGALAERGMVRRRRFESDRREVVIEITRRGEAVLRRLALSSLTELRTEGPALAASLTRLIIQSARRVP